MTGKEPRCERPEELEGDPEACPPEQIEKCHGTGKGHPCVEPEEER